MKKLIIFDIDGTLTETNAVDAQYFSQAVCEHLNIQNINTNWHEYQYSTDSGILSEIFLQHTHQLPSEKDISAIQDIFMTLLQREFDQKHGCTQIKGVNNLFSELNKSSDYELAIATGCWKKSAILKLNAANIEHKDIAKSCADDYYERTDIILHAIELAKQKNNQGFSHITYVGDRMWDCRAAKKLNINFIGVGNEFSEHSDIQSVPDFSDLEQFFFVFKNKS